MSSPADAAESRVARSGDVAAIATVIAFVTLLFFDVLFLGNSLAAGDLVQYHFPLKKLLHDLVWAREFPWWNRLIEAGQPIAANPAYELWYPLQWLVFLPSFVAGFKLHIVIHYFIAGLGMLALCRAIGVRPAAACLAACAFAASGPLISTAGYLPFLFSLAWLPWVLCFFWRYHMSGRRRELALAVAALSMQMLIGEPVVLIQSAVLLLLAGIAVRRIRAAIAIGAVAAAIAAVQLVPGVDHARDSVRSIPLDFATVSTYSSSVTRPLELFVPSKSFAPRRFVGPDRPFIYSIYIGLAIALLAIVGIVLRLRAWRAVALYVFGSYIVAIGRHTPLLRFLYDVRVFSSIRYPEKFLLGALFVLTVFAAFVADRLLDGDERVRRAIVIAASVVAITALICAALTSPAFVRWTWATGGTPPPQVVKLDRIEWLAALLRAAVLLVLLTVLPRKRLPALLVLFVAADVGIAASGMVLRVPDRFYADPPAILHQLPTADERLFHEIAFERGLGLRLMRGSPVESRWLLRNEIAPYIPAAWGRALAMCIDFDETTLFPSRRLRVAADIARRRGSPSWPLRFMALSNAPWRTVPVDPRDAVRAARGDVEALTMARIVREPLDAARYSFAQEILPCSDVFDCAARLDAARSQRVALVPPFIPAAQIGNGRVLRAVETPSTTDLDLEVAPGAPALLTMSVTFHKYWRATIDGRDVAILPTNLAYQALFVAPGRHHVRLVYRNPLVPAGGAITLVAIAGLILYVIGRPKRRFAPVTGESIAAE